MMDKSLLDRLSVVTSEEKEILKDPARLNLSKYGLNKSMVVNCHRLLQSGKTIEIRPHTRFVDFPAHKHNYIEMVYMCSGKTVHMVDYEQIVLNKGELLILNRDALHEVKKADKDDIAVNFIILTEFFDRAAQMLGKEDNLVVDFLLSCLFQDNKSLNFMHFKVGDVLPIQNLLENLIWTIVENEPNKRRIQQTTLGLLLLSLANHTDKLKTDNDNSYGFKNVVLRYVEENYKTAKLSELADILGMNFSAVSKRVTRQFGCTFKDLIMSRRLSQAEFLLKNSNLPINQIVLSIGYENVSYFYRCFKEKYGVSPATFRGSL
ncbi:MAG: AraC family transcriptional regulator [Acutalibacteraceae bacterium]|nr:AraC family transcriptional regulator [Acutalibacteraceae bacterium]